MTTTATEQPGTIEGELKIPYRWTAGRAAGRFLQSLRDDAVILGARCGKCGKVWAPPPECCAVCRHEFADEDFIPVGETGTVTTFTRVETPLFGRPAEPPYATVAVRLEGADTDLIHLVYDPDTVAALRTGLPVQAVWSRTRLGSILDIDQFRKV